MNNDFDETRDFVDKLLEQGALEIVGIDNDTGEILYGFTEKLLTVDPTLHKKMVESFHADIMSLWEKGFLNMDVTLVNPKVSVTDKVFDVKSIIKLSESERFTLKDIMNKMSE